MDSWASDAWEDVWAEGTWGDVTVTASTVLGSGSSSAGPGFEPNPDALRESRRQARLVKDKQDRKARLARAATLTAVLAATEDW